MTIRNEGANHSPSLGIAILPYLSLPHSTNKPAQFPTWSAGSTPHLKWTEISAFGHWTLPSPRNITPASVTTETYADFNHAMCSRVMPTCLTKTKSLIDLVPRHFKHRETPFASLLQCTLLSTSVTPAYKFHFTAFSNEKLLPLFLVWREVTVGPFFH